jgi:hypothetical protein
VCNFITLEWHVCRSGQICQPASVREISQLIAELCQAIDDSRQPAEMEKPLHIV